MGSGNTVGAEKAPYPINQSSESLCLLDVAHLPLWRLLPSVLTWSYLVWFACFHSLWFHTHTQPLCLCLLLLLCLWCLLSFVQRLINQSVGRSVGRSVSPVVRNGLFVVVVVRCLLVDLLIDAVAGLVAVVDLLVPHPFDVSCHDEKQKVTHTHNLEETDRFDSMPVEKKGTKPKKKERKRYDPGQRDGRRYVLDWIRVNNGYNNDYINIYPQQNGN